jgi:hypothetical protein
MVLFSVLTATLSGATQAEDKLQGALNDELPYIQFHSSCDTWADYAASLKSDYICSLRTVHEQLAWTLGVDRSCQGEKADEVVNAAAAALLERFRHREEVYESLRKAYGPSGLEDLARYVAFQRPLSDDERVLMFQYFQTGYLRLNPVLRQGGVGAQCLQPLVFALVSVLTHLVAPYTGTVYRGLKLSAAALAEYQTGHEFVWPAFSSTSVDRSVAQSFAVSYDADQLPVLLQLSSKSCRDVRGASDKLNEHEILCLPGTRVRVLRREPPNVVVLEEVDRSR